MASGTGHRHLASLPVNRVSQRDHRNLLALMTGWRRGMRPFHRASTLVQQLGPDMPPHGAKEYRQIETIWGVNVRSTMWAGPRGGAPMTVACLALLADAEPPMWPWKRGVDGLLAEAFPAAQLKTWGYRLTGTTRRARRTQGSRSLKI